MSGSAAIKKSKLDICPKEKKFGKGKERNYCGSVRVIFGNYADWTFYDGKKSFWIIE